MTRPSLPPAHAHAPLVHLNTTGDGIRSFYGCSCGHKPKKMPQSSRSIGNSYTIHARRHGVSIRLCEAVYAAGYVAAGLTWEQWRAISPPDGDPFALAASDGLTAAATPAMVDPVNETTKESVVITIQLREPADSYHGQQHGILFESTTTHVVNGPRAHNRRTPHQVQVWDNTGRSNTDPHAWNHPSGGRVGPGQYLTPDGFGTDSPQSYYLSAKDTIIATWHDPNTPTTGGELGTDSRVVLQWPDGRTQVCEIVFPLYRDPQLTPVADVAPVDDAK